MDAKSAKETLDRGIMITADKNLTVKDLSDHFMAKGYLAALEGPEFLGLLEALENIKLKNPEAFDLAENALIEYNEAVK